MLPEQDGGSLLTLAMLLLPSLWQLPLKNRLKETQMHLSGCDEVLFPIFPQMHFFLGNYLSPLVSGVVTLLNQETVLIRT